LAAVTVNVVKFRRHHRWAIVRAAKRVGAAREVLDRDLGRAQQAMALDILVTA
jgi:hypothetical protein